MTAKRRSGSFELNEMPMPAYPVLSNNTNITGAQALKESAIFGIMQDVFVFQHSPFTKRINNDRR